jgi:hypothetical protein
MIDPGPSYYQEARLLFQTCYQSFSLEANPLFCLATSDLDYILGAKALQTIDVWMG